MRCATAYERASSAYRVVACMDEQFRYLRQVPRTCSFWAVIRVSLGMFVVRRGLFRAFVSDSADFSLWLKRYLLGGRIGGSGHDAARERTDAIGEDRSGFCWDHGMDSLFFFLQPYSSFYLMVWSSNLSESHR